MKGLARHHLPAPVEEGMRALIESLGFAKTAAVKALAGGGNNRVFSVGDDERRVLVKWYFEHPGDPRDRLQAEWAFTRFAWENGIRTVPAPLAVDPACRLAVYEFVAGRLLKADEITADRVDEAARFIADVNMFRALPQAQRLAPASEACFSMAEHWRLIDARIARLAHIADARDESENDSTSRALDDEAAQFIARDLQPTWRSVRDVCSRLAHDSGIDVKRPLKKTERCLSPSDFGFHNALLEASGKLRFIDFEYSGWDDPAKLVCDFFCQVRLPVPESAYPTFLESVSRTFNLGEKFRRRVELLLPVYRLKWCTIVLNEFLPVSAARRQFSRPSADATARKKTQLKKARRIVELVQSTGAAR